MPLPVKIATLLLTAAALMHSDLSTAQPVTISGGAHPIPGILSLPRDGAAPAMLLLHGTASQKNEVGGLFRHLAQRLQAAGIASLRIDFAGTGDSPVSYRRYSLSSATADALRALDYLRALPAVNGGAIIVLGFSQGGLVAQRVAIADTELAGLVTWSTVAVDGVGSFEAFFDAHYATAARDGFAAVDFAWLEQPLEFDLRWFEEIRAQRTLTDMRAVDTPLFAIAGAADRTVPYAQSMALIAQSAHPQSRALLIAGADHIFNVLDATPGGGIHAASEQLLEETIRWAGRILLPQARPGAVTLSRYRVSSE